MNWELAINRPNPESLPISWSTQFTSSSDWTQLSVGSGTLAAQQTAELFGTPSFVSDALPAPANRAAALRTHLGLPATATDRQVVARLSTAETTTGLRYAVGLPATATDRQVVEAMGNPATIRNQIGLLSTATDQQLVERMCTHYSMSAAALRTTLGLPATATDQQVVAARVAQNASFLRTVLGLQATATDQQVVEAMAADRSRWSLTNSLGLPRNATDQQVVQQYALRELPPPPAVPPMEVAPAVPPWQRRVEAAMVGGFVGHAQYSDAEAAARLRGVPLVVVFGSRDNPQPLNAARAGIARGDAVYLYADAAAVDQNSYLGRLLAAARQPNQQYPNGWVQETGAIRCNMQTRTFVAANLVEMQAPPSPNPIPNPQPVIEQETHEYYGRHRRRRFFGNRW